MITPKEMRKLLRYERETGKLFWLERPREMFPDERAWKIWNTRYAGKEAFTADNGNGYRRGAVFDKMYRAHRVIWAIHTGAWPDDHIDHINGVRDDNRIDNLRAVSHAENQKNCRGRKDNTSGVMGVHWYKRRGAWQAYIKVAGKNKHLGYFKSKEDAIAARAAAEIEYGFHENHGR